MADNLVLNQGSGGETCATDDVSGVGHFQRVKITPGAADAQAYYATNYWYRGAASANQDSQAVKGSPGVLYGVTITNSASATRYVRLYNLTASATSASTPWRVYVVPAAGGIREQFPYGIGFTTGLCHRFTTGEANDNADAVTAGDIHFNCEYV